MTHMDAEPWIRMRLMQRGVFEEGGKWRADLRGEDVGTFASKKEALIAYRQAALEKFGDMGAFPTEDEIDAAADQVTLEAPGATEEPQETRSASLGAQTAAEPPKPASAPPRPAQHAQRPPVHQPPHKGTRR